MASRSGAIRLEEVLAGPPKESLEDFRAIARIPGALQSADPALDHVFRLIEEFESTRVAVGKASGEFQVTKAYREVERQFKEIERHSHVYVEFPVISEYIFQTYNLYIRILGRRLLHFRSSREDMRDGAFLLMFAENITRRLDEEKITVRDRAIWLTSLAERMGLKAFVTLSEAFPKSPPSDQVFSARPDKSETAPEFIQRVYGRWLTGEFTRADLRKIDPSAEMGLRNWERTHGRAEIELPTLKERNDRALAQMSIDDKPQSVREFERLRMAARRRDP